MELFGFGYDTDEGNKMQKLRKGQLVIVYGEDLGGGLNTDDKAKTIPFKAVGWFVKMTKKKLVLHTMEWKGLDSRDYAAFPCGCVTKIDIVK